MLPGIDDDARVLIDDFDDDIFLIAQKPGPVGPQPGMGMGPGPIGPGPVGPGPVGPGPVGPGPIGPGPIGPGTNPNQGSSTSFVSITASDKLLLIDIEIDWQPQYYKHISPSLRAHVDQLKGEAQMMTGKAHWHQLAATARKFEPAGAFPMAAYPRKVDQSRFDVPYAPDERVSWMTELLPYLGYDGLKRRIRQDEAWNAETNLQAGSAWISEFLNPNFPQETWRARVPSLKGRDLGATHFVGLTGIGMESGEFTDTPENAKKLGIFGWNRQTKLSDITDGLANTIYVIQAPPTVARPWIRGGGATAQGVPLTGSQKPFLMPSRDGRNGTYVLMADGSIRFLKEGIEDPIFQALVTYKGGEKLPDIDQVAPKERGGATAAVPPKVDPPKVDPPKVEPKVEPKGEPAKGATKRYSLKMEKGGLTASIELPESATAENVLDKKFEISNGGKLPNGGLWTLHMYDTTADPAVKNPRTPREQFDKVKADTGDMYDVTLGKGKVLGNLVCVEYSGIAKANKNVVFTSRACSVKTTVIVLTVTNTGRESTGDIEKILDSLQVKE